MAQIIRSLFTFFVPGGLILITALVTLNQGYLAQWLTSINKIAPYIVLTTGFLLGLRFHRNRLAFAVLLVALADRALYYFGPHGTLSQNYEQSILNGIALLLPLNVSLLYFLRERGLLNLASLARLFFFIAQPAIVYVLIRKSPETLHYLNVTLVQSGYLNRVAAPQIIVAVWLLILVLFLFLAMWNQKAIAKGFFWATLALSIGIYSVYDGDNPTLLFSTAGIILILSVIETAYAMAYHDELTGLPGRRALNTTLLSLGRTYTIAMLDIDFFKKFNDKYGHDVGDQVLCMVASHIRKVGGGGKSFRYGGEEFTIVFPGKTKKDARLYLEELRRSIADAQFKVRGKNRPRKPPKKKRKAENAKTVSVTISIGGAEPGRKLNKPEEVIKAADKALYRAKKKGRNCTVC